MNFIGHHKEYCTHSSLAHTEARLKSYESCFDVRAWSHDLRKRDRHLREWIKSDMPFCAVPITTLIGFFSAMTCSSRGKTTPRCHPDCKSKTILESITSSCEAMRECLKADRNLDKFFCEEELESSTWPCERCLEALKCIKMFWRILLEKVFAINLTKNKCLEHQTCRCDSVRDVARNWNRDMVQQAKFVKSIIPKFCRNTELDKYCKKSCLKKSNSLHCITPPCCGGDRKCVQTTSCTIRAPKCPKKRVTLNCTPERNCRTIPKGCCRCVLAKVVTSDACCGSCSDSEIQAYKTNIECLRKSNCFLREEVERLTRENKSLKCELQNLKSSRWKTPLFCATALVPHQDNAAVIPKPYENYFDDDSSCKSSAKGADSELLITMKNCKHESFKHVSLLQVLHKTNNPYIEENYVDEPSFKNEDPIELLTKVQATLGAMVSREMALANKKQENSAESEIEASFQRISNDLPSDSEMSYQCD